MSAFSALTLLVLCHEEHLACKVSHEVVLWLYVWSKVQNFLHMVQLMPLPCSQTPSSLALLKSRLVLPFWCQLGRVVLEKRLLRNGCLCLCKCVHACLAGGIPDRFAIDFYLLQWLLFCALSSDLCMGG